MQVSSTFQEEYCSISMIGLFWTAPEILRKLLKKEHVSGTSEADIYALGVIIKELLCRNEPYCAESHLSPKGMVRK
jgi:serine/threonine protein kinase